ncbi:outer membrane OprD family porin [Pseudomonas graminis]|uniref:OprD family porin n=1 Tax=Pseudomonas graminis TaxID=158627 RepID=UPI00105BD05A|nr:outer membrane OprD family porin [Pseudomonas graminis]
MARRISLLSLALLSCSSNLMAGTADEEHGFLADTSLNVLARNFFLDNDYRTGHSGQSYRQEWAQGFIANLQSGFTQGTVGFGVDAHAFYGLKLDSGKGRAGTGLLPLSDDGRAADDYSDAGGALKLRISKTTLKFGEQEVETPVLDTGDKRLQPEYATGFYLDSRDIDGLKLVAGHFTAFKNQNASTASGDFDGYGATTRGSSLSLVGVETAGDSAFGGSVYASQLTDTWRQYYTNLHHLSVLSNNSSFLLDGNLYRTLDQGDAKAGALNNTAYSLLAKYSVGPQGFSLGWQKIDGDTPFDFVGGDSIYLANSIKYADFNGAHEQSWQARYDLSFAHLGIPGLTFMTRYVRGSDIDGTHAPRGAVYQPLDDVTGRYQPIQGKDGRHWERDIGLKYVVQSGPAKNLSFDVSHVSHRGNDAQGGDDIDRLYIVLQYPLNLLD